MLKVGAINYINTLPLFTAFQRGIVPCVGELIFGVPSANNRALYSGELDLSLISGAEYLAHRDNYELISGFCVGAYRKVLSVCLYSRLPITSLNDVTIGLTNQSISSANLVKVLCRHFWKVSPNFACFSNIDECTRYEAFLLIGDLSLQYPSFPEYTTIDLAEEWWKVTKQPFTFAVFATRREVMEQQKASINCFQEQLDQALLWAERHPQIIRQIAQDKLGLSSDRISEYFDVLRFRLTPEMKEALVTFENLCSRCNVF